MSNFLYHEDERQSEDLVGGTDRLKGPAPRIDRMLAGRSDETGG